LGVAEALTDMQDLMVAVAFAHAPDRAASMHYTACRDSLLVSEVADLLPGVLIQCVSIASSRTFISLYHSDKRARKSFIEDSLSAASNALHGRPISRGAFDLGLDDF